jgi:hypothetical protein
MESIENKGLIEGFMAVAYPHADTGMTRLFAAKR